MDKRELHKEGDKRIDRNSIKVGESYDDFSVSTMQKELAIWNIWMFNRVSYFIVVIILNTMFK